MEAILKTIKDAEERYERGLAQARKEAAGIVESTRKEAAELVETEKRRIDHEKELTLTNVHETVAKEKAAMERSGQKNIQKVKDASNIKETVNVILRHVQEHTV